MDLPQCTRAVLKQELIFPTTKKYVNNNVKAGKGDDKMMKCNKWITPMQEGLHRIEAEIMLLSNREVGAANFKSATRSKRSCPVSLHETHLSP